MARIEKLLALAVQHGARMLCCQADSVPEMLVHGQRRSITTQPLSLSQLQELVREIFPRDATRIATIEGRREFDYEWKGGIAHVRLLRGENSVLRLEVMLHPPGMDATPALVAVAAAAPTANAAGAPDGRRARLETMFDRMVAERCSDLHLSVGSPPLFRKDGDMTALGDEAPLTSELLSALVREIASPLHYRHFEAHHDTDFSYEMRDGTRLRCNLFLDRRGMGAVFRCIPGHIPTAEELKLPKVLLELCQLPKGFVLVTGPTGSGKSTTLAAMIDHINRTRAAHIITIEDPIEFVYPNHRSLVNQREVGPHTEDFRAALRAALREDPDIVLVGELRDLETVAIAIETAETGHLVFGTLHTNTAPSAVDRIIDQFAADRQAQIRTMLSESLRGVVAQTLIKKSGGGRVAAYEILIVNGAIANLIREGKTFQIPSMMQTGRAQGMTTMNDALLELVRSHTVEADEALAKAPNRAEFKALLDRATAAAAPTAGRG